MIEDISLEVRPGELVGVMGPSGAGKSTLLKALGGYVRPSSGAVLLNGVDLASHYPEFRGQIGFVPQEDIIHRDLTVGEASGSRPGFGCRPTTAMPRSAGA